MKSADVIRVLTFAGKGLSALEAIGEVAERATGGNPTVEEAMAVLTGIAGLARSVVDGLANPAVRPEDLQADIAALEKSISGNNAVIDAAADVKFPPAPKG